MNSILLRCVVTNAQRVANARLRDQDIAALTQFSKTLVDSLVENQKQQNEDDLAEGMKEGYRQHLEGGLNTSSYDQGIASAKEQDAIASDVEASVQDNNPDNYEASANIGRATTWKEVGRRRGFALAAATGYPTFVDQELANQQFNSSAEYAAALAEVRKKFFKEAGLTGLDPKFLASSVYPQLQRADATSMRKWQKQFAQDDSFERQSEAKQPYLLLRTYHHFLVLLEVR